MPGQPYVSRLPDGRYFAVELPPNSAKLDPLSGDVVLEAPAIHLLDRLRVLLSPLPSNTTPARLRLLREAMGLNRGELAAKVGVSVQDVVSWETGRRRPSMQGLGRLDRLRERAVRGGVLVPDGERRRGEKRQAVKSARSG